MIIADLPVDEALRLNDLLSYDILDSSVEDDFNELVELAGQICNCPISLITLLDHKRQWFKAKRGLADTETSRDVAFCSHAILQDTVMAVADATQDQRFFDNPLVTGAPGIRFYAGAPIFSSAGHKLGTLCIIDDQPKTISKEEERALTILSNQVTKLLELRKKNVALRKRAEEIINLKSTSLGKVIRLQEEDKKNIAYTLHEDLAQRLASSLMYVNLSEENIAERKPLLDTAKEQMISLLSDIRKLTYSLTPYNIEWQSTKQLVEEFIENIKDTFKYKISIIYLTEIENCDAETTLSAIRIIEQWLEALADKAAVTEIQISIAVGAMFELSMKDDRKGLNYEAFKNEVFESLIYERVNLQQGNTDLSISSGNNSLKILLPLKNKKDIY